MEILRKGMSGGKVLTLQSMLKKQGFMIQETGVFDQQTYNVVCQFQLKNRLLPDGRVDRETWGLLALSVNLRRAELQNETHCEPDYAVAAKLLDVDEAVIRAVSDIASCKRSGFLQNGHPVVLFEGYVFWRELQKRDIDPHQYLEEYSDVLFPKWNTTSYKGGTAEYERLAKAARLNKEAALCSTSWGMYQMMGFNYKLCGCDSISQFVEAMEKSLDEHLLAFVRFLHNTNMDQPLKRLDWENFASKYFGPGYKQNQYDVKLQKAYKEYKSPMIVN